MKSYQALRALPALLLALALAFPVLPALAQDAGSVVSVDAPLDAQTAELGQDVTFKGWAANASGPGTGVDRVRVLDAPQAAGGQIVTEATYGMARADVAAAYGDAWTNSAFLATWKAAGAAGNRTFWVYAHSIADDGWTNKTVTIRLTEAMVPSAPAAAAPPAAAPPPQSGSPYVDPSATTSGQYRNPITGLYDNNQNRYQYGNQYNQYGQYYQYGQCTNPSNQYNNQYGQFGNQYSQYGQYDPYNQYNSQCNQYDPYNLYGSQSCAYNQYGGSYPYYGNQGALGTTGYGCTGYPQGTGISGPTVVATAAADGTVGLTWSAVSSASQYRVYQVSPSSYLAATVPQAFSSANVGATVSGLNPGSVGTYQVRAVGMNGVETVVSAVWTNTAIVTIVTPPQGVTPGASTSTSVVLSWTPSATAGTSYQVSQSSGSGGPFLISQLANATSSGATVSNLIPNTTYYFQVSASSGGQTSAPSATVITSTTA